MSFIAFAIFSYSSLESKVIFIPWLPLFSACLIAAINLFFCAWVRPSKFSIWPIIPDGSSSFAFDLEEIDFESMYQVIFKIQK